MNMVSNYSGITSAVSKENAPKTGTTIMAVAFDGGVVLGADTRVSMGSYCCNRVADKIDQVHDNIFCMRSGSSADTQAIADIVRYYLASQNIELNEPPMVSSAAKLMADLIYRNKNSLTAGMICAGWDKQNGGTIWEVSAYSGFKVNESWAIGGSGSSYIYGYCDDKYKKGMTKEQCQQFVTRAVAGAIARDGSSGGCIRLVTVDSTGVEKKFIPGNKLPFE